MPIVANPGDTRPSRVPCCKHYMTLTLPGLIAALVIGANPVRAAAEPDTTIPALPHPNANGAAAAAKPGVKPTGLKPRTVAESNDSASLTPERRAYLTEYWRRVLTPVAVVESRPFFFDINLISPPNVFRVAEPAGTRTMKLLARLTQRQWQQVHGVQVFTREVDDDPSSAAYFEHRALDWMRSLSPDDRQALMKGKLRLDQVDPAFRENIISWAINLQPAMASVLLNRGSRAGLEVGFNPVIVWKDARTGESQSASIHTPYPPIDVPSDAHSASPAGPGQGSAPADVLETSMPGPLDFGQGKVLELKEILALAKGAFGVRYNSDSRLDHATFFVSGQFRRDVFNDVLKAATTLEPAGESNEPHGWIGEQPVRDLINSGFEDLLHDPLLYSPDERPPGTPLAVSMSAFLNGDDMTVRQLAGASPGLMAHLALIGLGPDTMVHLRPSLVFMIDAGGAQAGSSID